MTSNINDFRPVVHKLRAILDPYASLLVVTDDSDTGYSLYTRHILPNKQPLFFGGIKVQKNYVSFYLMPVYVNPELLNNISNELRKRMQGKSCFNFKHVDEDVFAELARLARSGFERYQSAGYVNPAE